MTRPLCIGLFFGGVGPEHEASLSSASAVLQHLSRETYRLKLFGACKDGTWIVGDGAWSELYRSADPALLPSDILDRTPSEGPVLRFAAFPFAELDETDCAFPVIHGLGGEDGAIQGLLSLAGVPFTGSGVLGSAQSFDKWTAKQVVRAAGVPVAPTLRSWRHEPLTQLSARIEIDLQSWDLVVKPAASGSSFGVSRVSSPGALSTALDCAFAFGEAVLIERYVRHQELFLAVLGDAPECLVAKPVSDSDPKDDLSTYHDKYIDDRYPLQCPAAVPLEVEQRAKDTARTVFRELGCSGYARVDLFLCEATGDLLFNEINTLPALADDGAYVLGMMQEGWNYCALLDEIIAQALLASGRTLRTAATLSGPAQCDVDPGLANY